MLSAVRGLNGVSKGERFEIENIFVAYPYEEVTFREDIVQDKFCAILR